MERVLLSLGSTARLLRKRHTRFTRCMTSQAEAKPRAIPVRVSQWRRIEDSTAKRSTSRRVLGQVGSKPTTDLWSCC